MDLTTLFKKELEKRESYYNWASGHYNETIKGHTSERFGVTQIDLDSFDETEKFNFDLNTKIYEAASIQLSIFTSYIREMSGLEFNSLLIKPLDKQIEDFEQKYGIGPFGDYHTLNDSKLSYDNSSLEIMGQKFPLSVMEDKTAEEQKQIFFDMITESMSLNGYTDEQINNCIREQAIEMGGHEKSTEIKK